MGDGFWSNMGESFMKAHNGTEVMDKPGYDLIVKKSNEFVQAKYKTTLLEQKIVAISLTRIERDEKGHLKATILPTELKSLLGREKDSSHIYEKLKELSDAMTGHTIGMEDGKGNFEFFSMITNAKYINGEFSIIFNDSMEPHLRGLKTHYTKYSLANALQLKSNYAFRMYELIRMDSYLVTEENPIYSHTYSLAELKFMIGILNVDEKGVQVVKKRGGSWDEMAAAAKEKQFEQWGNFKKKVLDKAKTELDEVADYSFDYSTVKGGVGGKVKKVIIHVYKNDLDKNALDALIAKEKRVEAANGRYMQLEMQPISKELLKYIDHNGLTEQDLAVLLTDAGYDAWKVIDAIEAADLKPGIKNYMGYLRASLQNGYVETPVVYGSAEIGRKAKEAATAQVRMTEADNNATAARIWEKAKEKRTEKFDAFLEFLMENGLELASFEAVNEPYECGTKFVDWCAGKDIELF